MNDFNLPIEHYFNYEEIESAFIDQLKKDAAMCGIEFFPSNDARFDSLQKYIQYTSTLLHQINNESNGFQKIQNWLYRVDVPEKLIKQKLQEQTNSYFNIIAELIVKRTLQKVVIKYLHTKNL